MNVGPNSTESQRNSSNPIGPVLSQGAVTPFFIVGFVWLAAGLGISLGTSGPEESTPAVLKWMIGLWLLCMLDIFTAGVALTAVFRIMRETLPVAEKSRWVFRAIFWGTLKFVSLAALVAVSMQGQAAPKTAVVLGLSTLVVVPLIAGYFWSKKEAKDEPEQELIIDEAFVNWEDKADKPQDNEELN